MYRYSNPSKEHHNYFRFQDSFVNEKRKIFLNDYSIELDKNQNQTHPLSYFRETIKLFPIAIGERGKEIDEVVRLFIKDGQIYKKDFSKVDEKESLGEDGVVLTSIDPSQKANVVDVPLEKEGDNFVVYNSLGQKFLVKIDGNEVSPVSSISSPDGETWTKKYKIKYDLLKDTIKNSDSNSNSDSSKDTQDTQNIQKSNSNSSSISLQPNDNNGDKGPQINFSSAENGGISYAPSNYSNTKSHSNKFDPKYFNKGNNNFFENSLKNVLTGVYKPNIPKFGNNSDLSNKEVSKGNNEKDFDGLSVLKSLVNTYEDPNNLQKNMIYTVRTIPSFEKNEVQNRLSSGNNLENWNTFFSALGGGKGVLVDSQTHTAYLVSGTSENPAFITAYTIALGQNGVGHGEGKTPIGVSKLQRRTAVKNKTLLEKTLGLIVSDYHGDVNEKVNSFNSLHKGYATMTTIALMFNNGASGVGFHGTNLENSLGKNASDGCVRMANADIIHLNSYNPRTVFVSNTSKYTRNLNNISHKLLF